MYPSPIAYKIKGFSENISISTSQKGDSRKLEMSFRVKAYELGDPLSRIDWKRLAKKMNYLLKLMKATAIYKMH